MVWFRWNLHGNVHLTSRCEAVWVTLYDRSSELGPFAFRNDWSSDRWASLALLLKSFYKQYRVLLHYFGIDNLERVFNTCKDETAVHTCANAKLDPFDLIRSRFVKGLLIVEDSLFDTEPRTFNATGSAWWEKPRAWHIIRPTELLKPSGYHQARPRRIFGLSVWVKSRRSWSACSSRSTTRRDIESGLQGA